MTRSSDELILLPLAKVCEVTGWSAQHARRLAAQGKVKTSESEKRARNGKRERLYALASLPAAAQLRYAHQDKSLARVTSDAFLEPSSLPLFETPAAQIAPVEVGTRVALAPEDERQARERLGAITPLLDYRSRTNGHRPKFRLAGGVKISKLDDLVRWISRQHSVSARNLYRWLARFDKGGFEALADRARRDKGVSRYFGRPPERIPDDPVELAAEIAKLTPAGRRLAALYLIEKKDYQQAQRIFSSEFALYGFQRAPSYSAVAAFLDAFPMPFHHRRSGEKQFHDHCAPYVLRDYTTAKVHEWWVLDHGQDDFFAYNDFIEPLDRWAFPDLPHHVKLRMWLTSFMDIRSRYILGYAFSVNPSSVAICSALRMAVLRSGRVPRRGLLDRGEDMKKMGLIKPGAPLAHAGAFARLIREQWGTQIENGVVFSVGEHPQSKPIESWFKTKRLGFDSQVISYCGNKPENRPDSCDQLLDQHHAYLLKKRETTDLPRASQAILATVYWIEQVYNREHHHTGHAMGRRTPEQVLRTAWSVEAERAARAKLSPRALDELLWDRQLRVVSNECVRMYNSEYEPADAESLARLRVWQDRKVLIAADPYNLGDAIAIHPETGEFIAALQSKKLLAWGATRDQIRAAMRHQRHARKAVDTYHALLAGYVSQNAAEPFSFLGAPALAATGTDPLPPAPPKALAARAPREISSPFVDDAVRDFLAEEGKD